MTFDAECPEGHSPAATTHRENSRRHRGELRACVHTSAAQLHLIPTKTEEKALASARAV